MSWVKLDDKFHAHRKVIRAGLAATGLFTRSLSYAAAYETDGHIDADVALRLSDGDATLADKLVSVGLWECHASGYVIHDYLQFNPSAKCLRQHRKRAAARVREYRKRNALHTRDSRRPVTMGRDGTGRDRSLSLLPESVPDPEQARFLLFWHAYPRREAKGEARKAWHKLQPDEAVLAAILAALEWQRQLPQWLEGKAPHPATYLNQRRWEDERPRASVTARTAETLSGLAAFAARKP